VERFGLLNHLQPLLNPINNLHS